MCVCVGEVEQLTPVPGNERARLNTPAAGRGLIARQTRHINQPKVLPLPPHPLPLPEQLQSQANDIMTLRQMGGHAMTPVCN